MGAPKIQYHFVLLALLYLSYVSFLSWKQKLALLMISWILAGGHYTLYLMYHTLGRDFRLAVRGIPIVIKMGWIKRKNLTVPKLFRKNMVQHPQKVMFFDEECAMTFQQVEVFSNQVANLFLKQGFKKGDTVALFMENRTEYIPIWLGLAKIGVIPALINYNLRQDSLHHCVTVANSKAIITSKSLEPAVTEIHHNLQDGNQSSFPVFVYDRQCPTTSHVDMAQEMKGTSSEPEPTAIADSIGTGDPLLYIYTSGTTGLPKAVVVKHFRQLFVMIASHKAIGLSKDDVIYCHLPLYHSSGGQIATASAIMYGTKTFIKKKFSARAFWKDCCKYNITATQYIGEICRYLLATPEDPSERNHKVTKMFGNGLRPQLWKEFVTRFHIKNISEFYGATEGNSNIVNNENRVGAVGFVGVIEPDWLQELLLPLYLIKVDRETGEPIRNANGFCQRCEPDEPGEFIGKIVTGDPLKEFNGYREKSATEKKILQNVFKPGDKYFRSGDILVQDEFGWIYFMDRAGDTYRWKGENVSTAEVEAVVSKLLDGRGAVSYGVEIPGTEGRAGMVCVEGAEEPVNFENLIEKLTNQLPSYAVPVFYRFSTSLDMTGTYKLKKVQLQEEGYSPDKTLNDNIFVLMGKEKRMEKLTTELYEKIISGDIRF